MCLLFRQCSGISHLFEHKSAVSCDIIRDLMSFNDNSSVVCFFGILLPGAHCVCAGWILNSPPTTIPSNSSRYETVVALHCIHKRRLDLWFVLVIKAHLWIHFGQTASATISHHFFGNKFYLSQLQIHACMWFEYSKQFCSHQMRINFSAFLFAVYSKYIYSLQSVCVCANYWISLEIHTDLFKSVIDNLLSCLKRFVNWSHYWNNTRFE